MSAAMYRLTIRAGEEMLPVPLMVVETDRNRYFGILRDYDKDHFRVFTGYAGRPAILRYDEIEDLYLASQHQDVES